MTNRELSDLLFTMFWRGREDERELVEQAARPLTAELKQIVDRHPGLRPGDALRVVGGLLVPVLREVVTEEPRGALYVAAAVAGIHAAIDESTPPTPTPTPCAVRGAWPGTYEQYTAHPAYRRLADACKREWNYQCAINVNHRGPVEMHHRTYRGVPFGETWQELIPLCEDCHRLYHRRLPAPPRGLFDEVIEEPTLRKAA